MGRHDIARRFKKNINVHIHGKFMQTVSEKFTETSWALLYIFIFIHHNTIQKITEKNSATKRKHISTHIWAGLVVFAVMTIT